MRSHSFYGLVFWVTASVVVLAGSLALLGLGGFGALLFFVAFLALLCFAAFLPLVPRQGGLGEWRNEETQDRVTVLSWLYAGLAAYFD